MKLWSAALVAPALVAAAGVTLTPAQQTLVNQTVAQSSSTGLKWDLLTAKGLLNLAKYVVQNGWPNPQCTLDKVYVRKSWDHFSPAEKKDYIRSVLCLQTRPSQLNPTQFPGARNRYDDFVGVHINMTNSIHFTGNFLTWHRYFMWSYEWTLKNECGYKGYLPYYNYAKYALNPKSNPLFDGSDTSISGDGAPFPHDPIDLFGVIIPPAQGGGCITNGPFKDFKVNFGPAAPVYTFITPNPLPNGLGYNPRCLRRDINLNVTSGYMKDNDLVDLITNYNDITSWQNRLQGDTPNKYLGIHGGGHFTTGADPGGDLFASPGDPYFFFHHAGIDRLFWTWQNQDPASRTYVVGGTITFQNQPPSRNAELDDPLDLAVVGLAGVQTIRKAGSTLGGAGGPFCYVYA